MRLKQCIFALVAMLLCAFSANAQESVVAKIGNVEYTTFASAMAAANAATEDVIVEVYGAVEFVDGMELDGSYTAITFTGKSAEAKITINQTAGGDYLTAHGKTVAFNNLILAKANPAWSGNSGHMGNYFSIQGGTVTYTNCTFPNGACTSTGTAVYNDCTFQNASEYGLWVYDDALVTVNGGTIDSTKGIKVYSEGEDSVTSTLTVKNATFTENVTAKPAVAVGYAQSITLIGNTYNNTTAHVELDSGSDADCEGITFVAQDSDGNDIASTLKMTDRSNSSAACGVLVDGKIYTTVAQAAEVAAEGSNVTLLYSTTDAVEFAEGVNLTLANGVTADNVTVEVSLAGEGTEASPYLISSVADLETLRNKVNAGNSYEGQFVKLAADLTLTEAWTPIGNGTRSSKSYSGNAFKGTFDGDNKTISGLKITSTTGSDAAIGLFGVVDGGTVKNLTLNNVDINVANSNLAGGAIGLMLGGATAENITVNGAIVGNDGVGGIVGRLVISGTIENCTNNASVTSSYGGIGGIVGKAYYEDGANTSIFASIDNCTNNGTVTAPMYVGGIVGLARANVTDCVNNGPVVGGTQTGGIIGQLIAAGTVSGNENKAKITGKNHLGGIIGDYSQSSAYTYYNVAITSNINRGELAATEQCAAIMGCNNIDGFTAMTATGNLSYYFVEGLELFGNPEDMVIDDTNKFISPVAKIGDVEYATLAEAVAVAQAGDEIVLLGDVAEDATLPAGVKFNGNGKAVGNLIAGGEITFTGVTKAISFGVENTNTTVNIVAGACLEITGTGRMVIGHGCTFNITGSIEDAKTADVAALTPSLIIPGASFTGAGVTFNVTNAYISAPSSYCSSSKSASGTFDFNITNSIWESAGKLAFESQSVNATVDFDLKNSVLNTGSHLVFGVSRGEIVIDNSNVNVGISRQIENQSTMTIKNGAVVNGAVATSSNAKNPGTIIVENATYAVTGEFSGSDLGTGTIIVKKGATVSAGSITNANIQIDATGMAAGDVINLTANLSNLAGSLTVVNNDNLDASIVDGKIVLAVKPVAKIGETTYATLEEAISAAQAGDVVEVFEGTYAVPAMKAGIIIEGVGNVLLEGTLSGTLENLTLKNLHIKGTNAQRWAYAKGNLVFENVTFEATSIYALHFDGITEGTTLLYKDCTIIGWAAMSGSPASCVFDGCTIKDNGTYGVIRTYFDATIENCTFDVADANTSDVYQDGIHAVSGAEITVNGCTNVNGEMKDLVNVSGASVVSVDGVEIKNVAQVGDVEYTSLQKALDAAAAGTGNVTVTILADVDLTDVDWNPVTVSAPGYPVVTVEGGNHTITGLNDMLFHSTWAGGSGLIIKDLTIANSAIVNDKDDAAGTVGVGAFIGYPHASATITLENCHLKNSSVEGGHWTGGLIGMAGGYNGNDGPVFMNLTIKSCSVTGSTITGKGSVGGVIGHGSCAAWTNVVIEETTVEGNTITSTGSSNVKAGAIMGTIGAAGQPTTANGETKTGGASVSATVAGNTVTSNGTEITTIYGRQGTSTGQLYVAGGSYDNYPIEQGVAYAAPVEGYEIVENADGTYGVERNLQIWDGVSINTAWYNTTDTEFTLNTADELAGFAAIANGTAEGIAADTFEGKTIKLGNNIDLNNQPWAPIGGRTSSTLSGQIECTFDGQGYTISNLKVEKGSAYEAVNMNIGLFGITRSGKFVARNFTLENVDVYGSASVAAVLGRTVNCKAVIEDVTVKGLIKLEASTQNIAAICAQGYSPVINNCHVIGADGSYIKAGTVQVGGILGWSGESSKVTSITGCSIENVTISGEAYVGTIASILQYGATATNNNAKNVVLNVSDDEHHYGTIVGSVGAGYIADNGKATAPVTLNENTTENVKVTLNGTVVDSPIEYGAHYDGTTYLTARIGNDYYEDIDVAINAVQDDETITLIRDLTFTTGANGTTNGTSYTRGVNFTLDLNEKTITSDLGNNALRFKIGDGNDVAGKEVTINIKNGKLVSGANNWCAVSAATADNSNNKLIVNLTDLQIEANKAGDYAVKSWAGAVINTANVDITANYAGGFYAVGGEIVLDENSSVIQKGLHTAPYLSYAFGVSGNGKMTVNGGAYSAAPSAEADAYNQGASHGSFVGGVMSSGGTLIINGGTFSNDNFGDAVPTAPRALLAADAGANIEINGGTFNAMAKIVDDTNNTVDASKNANVTIKGGTFSADPTVANWGLVNLADGYVALPDLAGNYVVGVKPTATVNNLGMTTVAAGEYMVYGSGDNTVDMPLSFVMQFLADQTEEDMATSPYADWYGDFVITFTGLENGSFTADGCYLAGHYGSFGWVKVPVDGMTIEEGARYPVMLGVGMGQKYDYICSSVQDFKCALYLTPEILEANPNIQVKLELGVVDNSKGEDAAASALVNNENVYSVTEYTYDAEDFVVEEPVQTKYEFVDGEFDSYDNAEDVEGATVKYSGRNVSTTWTPLYVPFEIPAEMLLNNGYEVGYITGVREADKDNDGTIDDLAMEIIQIKNTSAILYANHPYFIRSTAGAQELVIELTDVTLYKAEEKVYDSNTIYNKYDVKGNLSLRAGFTDADRGISGGIWEPFVDENETLKPFRFYLTISSRGNSPYYGVDASAVKSMSIVVRGEENEDGTTTIYDIYDESSENGMIFDLQGRRVLEPQKGGLYIVNGKKVLVK